MKQKQNFKKSLIRPIFNAIIGLIMLLSAAIGAVGYFEFADALKQQYTEAANGIAENVALGIDAGKLDKYLESKKADDEYNTIRNNIQHIADAEDCSVIYVAKVHRDSKEREYIYNVVSKTSGFSPYDMGFRDEVSEEFLKVYDSIVKGESELHNFMYARKGYTTSVYPVKDDSGNAVAIVGVVKNMNLLKTAKHNYIVKIILIEALIAVVSGIFWTVYMRRRIVMPIRKLNEASLNMVEHLEDGTSPEIFVKNDDEIRDLADSFSKMYHEIGEYIAKLEKVTAEKERIGAELTLASDIQAHMLPCIFPAFPEYDEFDIYATMTPAKEVGGDFYDFFMTDENHLAVVMADVSGKGVPAALFMVIAKTLIKNYAQMGKEPEEVFNTVNRLLCEGNDAGLFVTSWMGILDLESGVMKYANAGHNPPLVKGADGKFEYLRSKPGFVLAGMDTTRYSQSRITLNPGDRIFLYTDGVTEATDGDGKLYGEERLVSLLNRCQSDSAEEMLRDLKSDIDSFVGSAPQFDDITMLMLDFKKRKTGENMNERVFPADDSALRDVLAFAEEELEKVQCPTKTVMQLTVALEEVFVNSAHYAYPEEKGQVKVAIAFDEENRSVTFRVADRGVRFNPLEKEDPDITLSADERQIGGLGIFICKKTMDEIGYTRENGENILTMTKKI